MNPVVFTIQIREEITANNSDMPRKRDTCEHTHRLRNTTHKAHTPHSCVTPLALLTPSKMRKKYHHPEGVLNHRDGRLSSSERNAMDGVTIIGQMIACDKHSPFQTYHNHMCLKGVCYGRSRTCHIKVNVLSKIDLIELQIIMSNCSACGNLVGGASWHNLTRTEWRNDHTRWRHQTRQRGNLRASGGIQSVSKEGNKSYVAKNDSTVHKMYTKCTISSNVRNILNKYTIRL